MKPGELLTSGGDVELNEGAPVTQLAVQNTSDRPVHVSSHYHFFEANKRLRFDRAVAFGKRLDIPAGGSVRWEARETRDVELVPFGGRQAIYGFNGLVNGSINARTKETALARARYLGYLDSASDEV